MIRVLVIDDSAVVRRVLSERLSHATDIEVVGTAVDPFAAREKILRLHPDVVTLDLDMPRMDGLTFLGKLMKYYPLPVIVVSSLTPKGSEAALRALELGAVEVIAKPGTSATVAEIAQNVIDKIRAAMAVRSRARPIPAPETPAMLLEVDERFMAQAAHKIIAIGASTGGTEAIKAILAGLPATMPGLLIVQHMPASFTAAFAKRLNDNSMMEVREARDGDELVAGLALVAPGDRHMALKRLGSRYLVEVRDGPPVHHQRPSVDVLFHSVARQAGANAVGVILTGMGSDGAQGLLAMRQAGAFTMAQDESSCVIFGMPKEAINAGAVNEVAALSDMPRRIVQAVCRQDGRAVARPIADGERQSISAGKAIE
jgi:two-component system, chemotaxis family, protein-glutamate methylesterase/glutaminase